MIEDTRKTYEELLRLEDGCAGGLWDAFTRGDVGVDDVAGFLGESIRREDHRRAIEYAEKLAQYYEQQKRPGIAKSFRRTLENQRRAYTRILREALPGDA